jgi:hypothetical protein
MNTCLQLLLAIIFMFFVVGCDFNSSKKNELNTDNEEIVDSLSFEELVELKNQNWETRLRSDDGYYSYVYNNDSLIFVEQNLCDEDGYPVDGVYGLYFQPFEEKPCYYTWFSAENYFSENQQPEFVAKLKDNKIIEILTDTDLRDYAIGEEVNDNFDLSSLDLKKSKVKESESNENTLLVGNFEISQKDLPKKLNWLEANQACQALGNGWRLPSKQEVETFMYSNKHRINDFIDKYYWSSEEGNSELGWIFRCTDANEFDGYNPKNNKYFVRAVRTISQ